MSEIQMCTFSIHDRRFGVDIADVTEIHHDVPLRPIPSSPSCVAGMVNIRGHVHLILNLRVLMGYPDDDTDDGDKHHRLLIFKPHIAPHYGIIIEGTQDIVPIASDSIVDRRAGNDPSFAGEERRQARSNLVSGVCMAADPLILVLKPGALADAPIVFQELDQQALA